MTCCGHPGEDSLDGFGEADVIILGLPAFREGRVYMPLSDREILTEDFFRLCTGDVPVAGGMFTKAEMSLGKARGIRLLDYGRDETFVLENAFYTAEGALSAIIEITRNSLMSAKILVVGGGRIAGAFCSLVSGCACRVDVYARRESQRAAFRIKGHRTFSRIPGLSDYNVVVNTVPADIFTGEHIRSASKDCLVVDLAGRPGYVSADLCREAGVKLLFLPGVPLWSAPRSAGISAAEAVKRMLDVGASDTLTSS